jgi:hypothetical protein
MIATILIGMWSVAAVIININACSPVSGFWDQSIGAKCLPTPGLWYVMAGGNIITDVIIFALPIRVLWNLSLPLSQRYSLVGVFCLGFL